MGYPSVYPTGTTIYYPNQCFNGYTCFRSHEGVVLIDMNGNVIHTWTVAPTFNKRSRLSPNGHLLYAGPNRTIIEYDWDGNIVWTHEGI